jgi:hypothetical protein
MTEIERALHALNYLDAGCSREEWVRIGMAAMSAGISFEDFNNWSACGSNYEDEKSCLAVWKSFEKSGAITPATLYGIAFARGWKDPSKALTQWTSTNTHTKARAKPKKPSSQTRSTSILEVWERCIPAKIDNAYIHRKQGKPDGLRVYPASAPLLIINGQNVAGYLVIPCLSDTQPQTLQFIPPNDGKKLNLPHASFNDGFFIVGEISNQIYICEGIGQAWAISKATKAAAVVCFGSGRIMTVTKVLREKYPTVNLVIVPDRGKEKLAAEVAAVISGQWIEMPLDKPPNYDANDYVQEYGSDALGTLLTKVKAPPMRFKLLSSADLSNAAPMRWLVRGAIPAKGLAALYGASGSGKSFLILDMGCAVAAGDKYWFGRRVTQTPVTYACLEGENGMGNRVKAWSLYFKRLLPDALRFITQPFDLLSDDVSELAKAVIAASGAGGLVIIDTLNRAAPGADENSSVDMGNIIASAKKLQTLIDGVVLLVHHTGKDATKGLRGHSSLYASLDGAIEVIKTDTRREWSVAKSKDDITGDAHSFRLEIVPVDVDEDGEKITSCVAVFDNSKEIIQKKKISLGSNQSIAREVLKISLCKSQHKGKEDAPPGKPCINYDEAVLLVAERMPTDARHRKSRAITAIAGLVGKKHLGIKGDWLWEM